MSDNNARVLAAGILNPDNESNQRYPLIGEITYTERFGVEVVDIYIFNQGIIRLTPDRARELIKELAAIGITAEDE